MKRSWIPAALMGSLALGYMAGHGSCDEGSPPRSPPPAASKIDPQPAPPPVPAVDLPASQAPPAPIPPPARNDGLGEYPAWNGVDLDCEDVDGPVRVTGEDPHRLDRDRNGIGCEGS